MNPVPWIRGGVLWFASDSCTAQYCLLLSVHAEADAENGDNLNQKPEEPSSPRKLIMTAEDKTEAKTLWSETVLEILYASLEKNKSDAAITEVLKEVKQKGFKRDYIINKVEKKVCEQAALRVKKLLSG